MCGCIEVQDGRAQEAYQPYTVLRGYGYSELTEVHTCLNAEVEEG